MPRVPSADNFRSSLSPAPSVAARAPQSNGGGIAGRQLTQLGDQVQRTGAVMADQALKAQQEANEARVFQAYTTLAERTLDLEHGKDGFKNMHGLPAVEGIDGKPLASRYRDTAEEQRAAIAASLGNDRQRELFGVLATKEIGAFHARAVQHEAAESVKYQLGAAESGLAIAANRYVLAETPEEMQTALGLMNGAIASAAQVTGQDALTTKAITAKALGNMVGGKVSRYLDDGDTELALALYESNRDVLDADSIVKIEGQLSGEVRIAEADRIVDDILGGIAPPHEHDDPEMPQGPPPAKNVPTEARMRELLATAVPGAVVTNGKRSPEDYERLRAAGYKPAKNSYHNDGQALDLTPPPGMTLDTLLVRTKAAYAAKGITLVEAGVHDGTHVHIAWGDRRARNASEARPAEAQNLSLSDAYRRIDASTRDPKVRSHAKARIREEYSARDAEKRDQAESALLAFQRSVQPGQSWTSVPASLRESLRLTGQVDAGMNYLKAIDGGAATTDMSVWLQFKDDLAAGRLDGMTSQTYQATYGGKFSNGDLDQGYSAIQARRDPSKTEGAYVTSLDEVVISAARGAGVITLGRNGKPDMDKESTQRFEMFRQDIQNRITAFEATENGGKKASRAQIQAIVDTVAVNGAFVKSAGKDEKVAVATLTPKQAANAYVKVGGEVVMLSAIPAQQRMLITSALMSRGLPVTETAIAQAWVANGRRK